MEAVENYCHQQRRCVYAARATGFQLAFRLVRSQLSDRHLALQRRRRRRRPFPPWPLPVLRPPSLESPSWPICIATSLPTWSLFLAAAALNFNLHRFKCCDLRFETAQASRSSRSSSRVRRALLPTYLGSIGPTGGVVEDETAQSAREIFARKGREGSFLWPSSRSIRS